MKEAKLTLTKKEAIALTTAGGAAPSGGNAQPWIVTITANTIQLNLNPKRAASFLDAEYRASLFALGCFTTNFLVKAASMGLEFTLKLELESFNRNHLTIWTATLIAKGNKTQTQLASLIRKRCTNRKLYNGRLLDNNIIRKLENSISSINSIKLTSIYTNSKKSTCAQVLGKADLVRFENSVLRKEMMEEFRWTKKETNSTFDGIDVDTLEAPPNLIELLSLVRDNPQLAKSLPEEIFLEFATPLLMNSSHLCMLYGKSQTISDWFDAGKAMQIIWLHATKHKLAIQPWSILSFFEARNQLLDGKGFTSKDTRTIGEQAEKLKNVFDIPKNSTFYFIFRLSQATSPKTKALRLSWERYTKFIEV